MALENGRRLPQERQNDLVWDGFTHLKGLGFLEGNEVTATGLAIGTQSVTLQHGLGRIPRGFLVTRSVYAFVLYEESSTTSEITFSVAGYAGGDRSFIVRVF